MLSVVQENWSTVRPLSNYFQIRWHCYVSHLCTEECPTPGRKMCSLPGRKWIFLHTHASFWLREEALTAALLVMTCTVTFKVIGMQNISWLTTWFSVLSILVTLLPSKEPTFESTTMCLRRTPVSLYYNAHSEKLLFHPLLKSFQHWWSNLKTSKLGRWLGEVRLAQWVNHGKWKGKDVALKRMKTAGYVNTVEDVSNYKEISVLRLV